MNLDSSTITTAAMAVGLIGDGILNWATQDGSKYNFGLRGYFKTHGSLEAMFIAGTIMWVTMWLALKAWPHGNRHPHIILFLFLFGSITDILYRELRLMPSLDGMYEEFSPMVSMFWAGGPLVLAYLIASLYE
jgi:hypothetical protein